MQIQIPYIRIKLNQIPTLAIPISQYIYFRNTYAKQNPKYSRIDIRVSKIKDKSSDAMIIINIQKNEKNIAMSTGWNSHRENHQGINFDELFADPTFNAIKLIAIPNIVNQCKTQQDSITDKLISKPDILDDLLTICLRPEHIKNTEFGPITTQHTFRALEIINSLEIQRFSQYLLGMKKKQQVEDDVVVTQDILESKQEIVGEEVPLFTKVLINLKQQKPLQETPLGYMCKIATNICSQKPKQVLKLLKQNKNEIINLIFQHFYSNSTLQFFIRVLEMEDSNSFYQPEKVAIFQHFAHALGKNDDVLEIRIEILENYATLLNFLFEKTDDRFDKAKFISLCKQIFPYKFPIQQILTRAKFLITTSLTSSSIQQLPYIFLILEKYLHFHNNFKPGLLNNINNSISHNSNNRSQGNIGNSMGQGNNGLDASVVMDIILDSQIVAGVRDFSFQISKIITGTTNKQEIKQQNVPLTFLLPYFKLVRSLLIILDPQQEIYIQTLITSQLIRYLLRLIDVHRSSTILHNTFKDIMIQCLVKNYDYIVPLLFDSKNCNFLSLASEMRSKGNSKQFQYENQIYHIIQITIKRGEDSSNVKCLDEIKKNCPQFQELISKIKEKEKLYSTLIGGDPRKQSSYWGQDSQEDRIFTTTQKMTNSGKKITQEVLSPNANDLIEGNIQHWFDCGGLPLDSDESKDEQDGQQEKKQEAGNPNSPVYINVLGDFQRQEQKEKQREKQKQKQSNNRQAQSELSKKLKNIGIKQCEQQQIRIPIKKQRYENTKSNRKKSKESIQMQLKIERPNEIKKVEQKQIIIEKKQSIDKVEEQLEDQIRKLEDKRLHHQQVQNQEPQIQQRVQKKVDSIQQSQIAPIQTNPSKQPIIISSLMDLSSDKDKSLQNQSLQQQNNTVSEEKVKIQLKPDVLDSKQLQKVEQQPRSDEKNKEEQNRSGTSSPQKYKKVSQNNYFPTYLSFQIDQILAELDQYLPWSRQPKSL